ncbi:MAG: 2,4-diaminopentanoate dehydrogenase [Thermovirgaceae bacterium]
MKPVNAVIWGLGSMGVGLARMISGKNGIQVCGAIDKQPEKAGKDLSSVTGAPGYEHIPVARSLAECPLEDADIVLVATASHVKDVFPQVMEALSNGLDVITTAEEMAYPWPSEPELSKKMDEMAREQGHRVLGTGINPGFVMDLLAVMLTAPCAEVERVRVTRTNDLSPFGLTVLKEQGVGMTAEEFRRKAAEGTLEGHVGFLQSIHMISDALGLNVDRIEQSREPVISSVYREEKGVTVRPGMVAGCRQTGRGYRKDECVIELIHPQQIHPWMENIETGDFIEICSTPDVAVSIKPEIPGGLGTVGLVVNSIPLLFKARPGLLTMLDLHVPTAFMGDFRSKAGFLSGCGHGND